MPKRLLLIIAILHSFTLKGQRLLGDVYNTYMYDLKIINPAFTSRANEQSFNTVYKERPVTNDITNIAVSYDNHISKLNSGVGLLLSSNSSRALTETSIRVLYNYTYRISDDSKLTLGVGVNHLTQRINTGNNRVIVTRDFVINVEAPTLKKYNMDFGVGYIRNGLMMGIGLGNLTLKSNDDTNLFSQSSGIFVNGFVSKDLNMTSWLVFRPSIYFFNYYDQWNTDLNSFFEVTNLVIAGLSYNLDRYNNRLKWNVGISYKDQLELLLATGPYEDLNDNKLYWHEVLCRIRISNK